MRRYFQSFEQTILGIKYSITLAPITSLDLMHAKQLQTDRTHLGCYLQLKIEEAILKKDIQAACKDHRGQRVDVEIKNFPLNGKPYSHYFYNGMTFCLKEPYFSVNNTIPVEVRNDIVFQKDNQPLFNHFGEGKELAS
jgi:hypothetical protein